MTQDKITLLLTDVCGRLKSNLICKVTHKDSEGWKEEDMVLSGIIDNEGYFTSENGSVHSCEFKPYLRPMSSMTEEEKQELDSIGYDDFGYVREWYKKESIKETGTPCPVTCGKVDFCNKNHFDHRGLIEKGLAIEAKKGMYKYKIK